MVHIIRELEKSTHRFLLPAPSKKQNSRTRRFLLSSLPPALLPSASSRQTRPAQAHGRRLSQHARLLPVEVDRSTATHTHSAKISGAPAIRQGGQQIDETLMALQEHLRRCLPHRRSFHQSEKADANRTSLGKCRRRAVRFGHRQPAEEDS